MCAFTAKWACQDKVLLINQLLSAGNKSIPTFSITRRINSIPMPTHCILHHTLSFLAMGTTACLSLSMTVRNTFPEDGSFCPAAMAALAYALAYVLSIPMTSPVERISGPSNVSAPAHDVQVSATSVSAQAQSRLFCKQPSYQQHPLGHCCCNAF